MDLSKIMEMAEQMRGQMEKAQKEAADVKAEGEAGGGMVKVTMNGRHEVVKVIMDPAILTPDQAAFVEDLVRAATNQASSKISELMQNQAGSMASDMGIDLSQFGIPNK